MLLKIVLQFFIFDILKKVDFDEKLYVKIDVLMKRCGAIELSKKYKREAM